jgi:hypothetical protein
MRRWKGETNEQRAPALSVGETRVAAFLHPRRHVLSRCRRGRLFSRKLDQERGEAQPAIFEIDLETGLIGSARLPGASSVLSLTLRLLPARRNFKGAAVSASRGSTRKRWGADSSPEKIRRPGRVAWMKDEGVRRLPADDRNLSRRATPQVFDTKTGGELCVHCVWLLRAA